MDEREPMNPHDPAPALWRIEFGEDWRPPYELLHFVEEHEAFGDASWHNDIMPSFIAALPVGPPGGAVHLTLWCDHPDPEQREMGGPRFRLSLDEHKYDTRTFWQRSTNDLAEALRLAEWPYRMIVTAHRDLVEILDDPPHPDRPITDFTSMHDQVDANVLGDADECLEAFGGPDTPIHDNVGVEVIDAAHHLLDHWLIDWRHGDCGMYQVQVTRTERHVVTASLARLQSMSPDEIQQSGTPAPNARETRIDIYDMEGNRP